MPLVIWTCFVSVLLVAGCATSKMPSSSPWPSTPAERHLALAHSVPANAPFGSIYEVRIYIVQAGDTLSKISERLHLAAEELACLNGYEAPDSVYLRRLRVGQRLVIYERISQ